MKKIYILLFTIPVLFFTLLYLSIWWFLGCMAMVLLFIGYRFYAERLQAARSRTTVLELEVEELDYRLENAVVKEQKTRKESEQVKELKQQLLTVISHEIRTPMNGVLGTSLLLSDTQLTDEQTEYLATIRSCSESLLTTINNLLVNNILDFSKLQKEGNQLEYKDFDLRDAIEEVLDLFAVNASKARLEILYEIDAEIPEYIIGDSKRLRQVLINLVENAVRFTHRGEIFVSVQYTLPAAGLPLELKFQVSDTGIGISKEQLKQLFQGIPGKEIQKSPDIFNPGLGLVICKKLVELMGGRIEVVSKEGQGTTFTFNLPLTPSLKSVRNHAHLAKMSVLEGKQVMVVDDNAHQLAILLKQLKIWNLIPVSAVSGHQALEILSKNSEINFVLTDLDMPDMNGIQLAKSIGQQFPSIPVIGMNASPYVLNKQDAALFSAIISKPLRQHILRDSMIGALSKPLTGNQTGEISMSDDFAVQHPLQILIAEDNLINQKIAVKILSKLGYEPSLANNGKEALEMVSIAHYDLILMDIQMPEMNGLEATRMIRTCLEIQPIIIALTANAMQGDRDDCMQAGMDDYMSKPIELKELLAQLEKWSMVIREKQRA